MGTNARAWLAAGITLLVFAAIAWPLPGMFGVLGTRAILLRGGLIFFGMVAAVLVLLYLRSRGPAEADSGSDDMDGVIASAESRLASSRLTAESRLGRLPLALVLGPPGSTKSSVVVHSGLDPELLAGEVMRGDAVIPTDPINVWYAHGSIIVEAGGGLLDDADRWRRLMRHLQPRRFAAAVGRGRQAPRIAILCVPCDEFLKPGASQAMATLARQLRARLGEASQQLGIRLPVYLLFTRADRLPFFGDYVRSFSNDEAQQVLGATLPLTGEAPGSWAERESRRLSDAFGRMVDSLARRRIDILPRETHDEVRAGAYEFPRELRKIAEPAVQLLVDIFRPSQLGVNPFLRGFYLTGVRPVILRDVIAEQAPQPTARSLDAGATSVFSIAQLQQAAQHAAAPAAGGRKVPQWVFLQRLFRDVVLRDDVALRITGGGTRVDLLRRGLIAAAAAACVIISLGFTVSYFNNRGLIRASTAAATAAREVGRIPGLPGEDELVRLDALRERAAQVSDFQHAGRPLHYAWGLYTGERLYPLLNTIYFARFDDALWNDTRARLQSYLELLPDRPDETSDFGRSQDALAAYLLTTSMHDRSEPDLLTPALLTHRPDLVASDSMQLLARRQFDYFATELARGGVPGGTPDERLVTRSQAFLREFGPEVYYSVLISEAERTGVPVQFDDPSGVVRSTAVVPAAFTRAGRRSVRENLDSIDHLFTRNQWIYGGRPPANKPQREELAALYEAEYVQRWQSFLDGASVQGFSSTTDGASRIGVLAGANSPLIALLARASQETAMDSTSVVGRAFQPLHATVPPDDPRGPAANLTGYLAQLNALQSQLNLLRGAPGGDDEGRRQASAAADRVAMEVGAIAASYIGTDAARGTGQSLQRLLRQPSQYAQAVVGSLPDAALNQAGASFCGDYRSIQGAYPFSTGGRDAPPAEVGLIFRKDSGLLWSFYDQHLQQLLLPQGRARSGQRRVAPAFERFFTQAAAFSEALYGSGGAARIAFNFSPIEFPEGATEVTLEQDRSTYSFPRNAPTSRNIEWRPETGTALRLIVQVGSEQVVVASGTGPWAVFRVFQGTSWSDAGGGQYQVEWRVPGRGSLRARVRLEQGVAPVLRPGSISALSTCAARILN
jgi:type VI secretion system protein ImpL